MKLANQSSYYTAAIFNQSAGKSSSGTKTKWSVNYEQPHKQGRSAFELDSVDSLRSTPVVATEQPVGAATEICSIKRVTVQSFVHYQEGFVGQECKKNL